LEIVDKQAKGVLLWAVGDIESTQILKELSKEGF
jgi:hypothetical protein